MAFRLDSHISDITSTPSVDVSDWDDVNTHHSGPNVLKELDSLLISAFPSESAEQLCLLWEFD